MRESNFTFPPQNRAVVTLTHLLYDRRALDTSSPLAILNNLTSLTYLTSTSPRIREILVADGGLERLIDILRDSLLPRNGGPTPHDLWGLEGPPTARVISVDRSILLRHSLAFQCVVNVGVRGTEAIRTRVVQGGTLDLVAQILESWLKQHGISIFAGPLGSQVAVDALAAQLASASNGGTAAGATTAVPVTTGDGSAANQPSAGSVPAGTGSRHAYSQYHSSAGPYAPGGAVPNLGPAISTTSPLGTTHVNATTPTAAHPATTDTANSNPITIPSGRIGGRASLGHFLGTLGRRRDGSSNAAPDPVPERPEVTSPLAIVAAANSTSTSTSASTSQASQAPTDTDVDMADGEHEGDTDVASIGADDSMEVDQSHSSVSNDGDLSRTSVEVDGDMDEDHDSASRGDDQTGTETDVPGQSATPRASQLVLPLSMSIPQRQPGPADISSQTSSAGNSFSSDNIPAPAGNIPRTASDNTLATLGVSHGIPQASGSRPAPLNLSAARIPSLASDAISTQSSPTGTPTRSEMDDNVRAGPSHGHARRDTIVARPVNLNLALPQRQDRRGRERGDGAGSEASDVDVDLQTATIHANVRAVQAQANPFNGLAETQDGQDADLVVAAMDEDIQRADQINEEAMAAEQARLDMEAGAPPGQPGAAQTPRVPPNQEPTPRAALLAQAAPAADPANPQGPAQIIIANGAPRGFNDLGSYVGISSLLNPEGEQYSDDAILLSLQLLAYLSKYPHVRASFHHPHRPMHPTFDLTSNADKHPLPQRPACSETPNMFSLVERFTFRPSPSDPRIFRIPAEIQYWAGVIMRNACRKDDARGGIRQCANMSCGKWETFPREFAKCRRCRKAKYCDKDCQSKAWSEGHKFWCSARTEPELAAGQPPQAPGGHGGGGGPGDDADGDADDDIAGFQGGGAGAAGGGGAGAGGAGGDARRGLTDLAGGLIRRQGGGQHHHGRHHGHQSQTTTTNQSDNFAEMPNWSPRYVPRAVQEAQSRGGTNVTGSIPHGATRGGAHEAYDPLLPPETQLDLLRQTGATTAMNHMNTAPSPAQLISNIMPTRTRTRTPLPASGLTPPSADTSPARTTAESRHGGPTRTSIFQQAFQPPSPIQRVNNNPYRTRTGA